MREGLDFFSTTFFGTDPYRFEQRLCSGCLSLGVIESSTCVTGVEEHLLVASL